MNQKNNIFDQLIKLTTEKRNRTSRGIDTLSTTGILDVINKEDKKVFSAVRKEIAYISEAVKIIVRSFKKRGRLIYIGAGTSGRLGILDASECPPTYGTNQTMIQGLIAGGKKAVFVSQEGAEDRGQEAIDDLGKLGITNRDVVCGIAASLRTPYVVAGIREAKRLGAKTILITTNPRSIFNDFEFRFIRKHTDVAICPDVGPEVIMGSTRMKSGTAQKLVLNMITTTTMIQLGKVYENMMVDLKMNSKKLEERAKRVLMITTGIDYQAAESNLKKSGGHVKTAIVMIKANVSAVEAKKRLKKANGFVRQAIDYKP